MVFFLRKYLKSYFRIEKGSSESDDDSDGWMHKIPGYKIYKEKYTS